MTVMQAIMVKKEASASREDDEVTRQGLKSDSTSIYTIITYSKSRILINFGNSSSQSKEQGRICNFYPGFSQG